MLSHRDDATFEPINRAYNEVFRPERLSIGLVSPLERYPAGPVPTMTRHLERAQLADELGFAALWLRDVPFNVPTFGDAGQTFDPFVYLGLLAGATNAIALGVASLILPLRHPAHAAKSAASVDVLSGGRLLLGIASGDRPEEYPAMGLPFDNRGERFRESYGYIRRMADDAPAFASPYGEPGQGVDLLPKPTARRLPLLVTGASQQETAWIAQNGDGWMLYPRNAALQAQIIGDWRAGIDAAGLAPKPVMEPLYIDLVDDPDATPQPIHLGLRLGSNHLRQYLKMRQDIGVNHVAINLRFNMADTETTMQRLADEILPDFAN